MPTLSRYLRFVLVTVGLLAGAVAALAYLVHPRSRTMVEPVDASVLRDAGTAEPTPAPPGSS